MKKKSRKKEAKKRNKVVKKEATDQIVSIPEKPFDFGGLPERNLKKSLGCG